MPEIPRRLRRRMWPRRPWLRRMFPAGVAAILVVGGTVVVRNSATASPIDTYRTTTVTTGSVEQRLNLTGSAKRVNQVSQGFAVTGTVSSVSVAVGDTVTAGEALASLDPAPLQSAVISATASLAKAKATLESDQRTTTTATTGTSSTSSTSSTFLAATTTPGSTPVATSTPTTSPRVAGSSGRKGAGTSLAQAQQRVTSAQQDITADLRQASAALAQCEPFFPSESTTSSTSPTASASSAATTSPAASTAGPTVVPTSTSTSDPTSTSTSTSTPTPTSTPTAGTPTPSNAEITACVSALRAAPTQQQIQRHQQALSDSQSALMTTVTLALTTTNPATTPDTTSPSTSTGKSSTGRSAASGSSGSQSSGSQPSTRQPDQTSGGLSSGTGQSSASRAVTDQAAVTNAEAALISAQADLTSATLKSSIGGTVGSVSLVKGASSQGKSVVIVGTGAVEVTVDVPLASIGTVHVGQKANVTPQGATSIAAGSVTSISLLPSTSSSSAGTGSSTGTGSGTGQTTSTTSSATYPVVVLVPDALPALATGSRADVSLLIAAVSNVLTVPNSVLTPLAKGQALAVTLKNGVATRALVKTGYAGTLTTQITSGLSAGQQVVLADLNTALPTNTTSSRRLGFAGGSAGGLGSAGFGGVPPMGGTGFRPPG